jgi:hypothetical protein
MFASCVFSQQDAEQPVKRWIADSGWLGSRFFQEIRVADFAIVWKGKGAQRWSFLYCGEAADYGLNPGTIYCGV